ncbi:MAG: ribonuclease P protein component [Methylophilaceae bacterium]|nr:ribonuclease P protein component [Methylophilaceae bacterium]
MIRKTDEFSSVFSFRKRYTSTNLVVHYKPSDLGVRVGFVVAKKVAKRAVDRNYMRRVLRELCRQELAILSNVDVVIQVKKPFTNKEFLLMKQELVMLFNKIQLKIVQDYFGRVD